MYSPKWLFLYPGTLLILAGAVLGGILLFGPLEIDSNVVLGLNTFVASCFMVICGVQIVSFGLLARHYASVTGMLPRGKRSDWIAKNITTDNVVRVAVVLFVLGLATFGFAANEWAKVGFGSLDNPIVPRTVVAGLSLVVIAIQLAFQGFMVGILQIPLARRPPQTAEERHGHAADSPELTQVAVKNGNLLG
jgi:hypothetical protein